jgi:hypothetical protein
MANLLEQSGLFSVDQCIEENIPFSGGYRDFLQFHRIALHDSCSGNFDFHIRNRSSHADSLTFAPYQDHVISYYLHLHCLFLDPGSLGHALPQWSPRPGHGVAI